MSTEPQTPPAFPEARAKKISAKKSLWLMGLVGVIVIMIGSGILGAIMGYGDAKAGRAFDDSNVPLLLVAFGFAAMIPTFWWSVRYWKAIDEMARRAHLDAFFWGGGVISWAIFMPVTLPMIAFPAFKFDAIENLSISATHAFGLGAFTAIMVTLLGYSIFWLFWWAKKR